MPDALSLLAPAKINWSLEITGKRADGYHQLRSIIQNIDLYDQIQLSWSDHDECVCAPAIDCPPKDNLAMRAWFLLKEAYTIPGHLRINIEKNIPSGRGLGGGSSDAAAVLLGVNIMAELGLSVDKLCQLAFPLGADIPFCLYGGLALVEGAGEVVKQYTPGVEYRLILADPGVFLSTKEVYRHYDDLEESSHPDIERLLPALLGGDMVAIKKNMVNMLERSARDFYPGLDDLKTGFALSGYTALLSGRAVAAFLLYHPVGKKKANP